MGDRKVSVVKQIKVRTNRVGQRFARLEVIARAEDYVSPGGQRDVRWECRCDCTAVVTVRGAALTSGNTQSCGCWKRERTGERSVANLIGRRFHRLVVTSRAENYVSPNGKRSARWYAICDCGNTTVVLGATLARGDVASCGCLRREVVAARNASRAKHGHAGYQRSPEYRVWVGLLNRCFNPRNKGYPNYGGRGITVAPEWQGPTGFQTFLADMGPRPGPEYSIDRIDNDSGYRKGNCRWADAKTQAVNRRPRSQWRPRKRSGPKLNESKVAEIRAASGLQREIAEQFRISPQHVGRIKSGRSWADVGDAA
jgi:hypothetical protein